MQSHGYRCSSAASSGRKTQSCCSIMKVSVADGDVENVRTATTLSSPSSSFSLSESVGSVGTVPSMVMASMPPPSPSGIAASVRIDRLPAAKERSAAPLCSLSLSLALLSSLSCLPLELNSNIGAVGGAGAVAAVNVTGPNKSKLSYNSPT